MDFDRLYLMVAGSASMDDDQVAWHGWIRRGRMRGGATSVMGLVVQSELQDLIKIGASEFVTCLLKKIICIVV